MSAKNTSGIELKRPEGQADLTGVRQTDENGIPIEMDKREVKAREAEDFDPDTFDPAAVEDPELDRKQKTARKKAEAKGEPTKQRTDTASATRDNNKVAQNTPKAPTKEWKA